MACLLYIGKPVAAQRCMRAAERQDDQLFDRHEAIQQQAR